MFKKWQSFCSTRNINVIPANYFSVAMFLTDMLEKGATKHTVIPAVHAIKYHHQINGHEFRTNNPYIKGMMDAANRLPKLKSNKKLPIPTETIINICEKYKDSNSLADIRDLALISLSFAGFLRFDEVSSIKANHIKFEQDHMQIYLPKSKTDQIWDGTNIVIAKGETAACPMNLTKEYLARANIKENANEFIFRPLFRSKSRSGIVYSNKKISYSTARECCIKKLKSVGYKDIKSFGLHSFRSGGATAAAKAKISGDNVKRHGRWRTEESKERYIRKDLEERLEITKSLGL